MVVSKIKSEKNTKVKKGQKHSFKLVDTCYPAHEAKQVLLALINDKIKFLNVQILSITERYNGDTSHLENRVIELKEEKERLKELLKAAKEQDLDVTIDGNVELVFR
jgi:hypothetical protein